jgi:hypothetical protein
VHLDAQRSCKLLALSRQPGLGRTGKTQLRASGYALSQLSRRTLMKPVDNIHDRMPLIMRPPIMRNGRVGRINRTGSATTPPLSCAAVSSRHASGRQSVEGFPGSCPASRISLPFGFRVLGNAVPYIRPCSR